MNSGICTVALYMGPALPRVAGVARTLQAGHQFRRDHTRVLEYATEYLSTRLLKQCLARPWAK